MLRQLTLVLLTFISFTIFGQSTGYEYKIQIKGMEDTVIFLGHHYGDRQYVIDTLATDNKGLAIAKGNTPLPGGIYLIVMPKLNNRFFEMIINEPSFSMSTDTADFAEKMKVTNSVENTIFYEDLNFLNTQRKLADPIKEQLKSAEPNSEEAIALKAELEKINNNVEAFRNNLIEKYPNTFYVKFIQSFQDPKIPPAPLNVDGSVDSTFAYRWIRVHYFDNVDFNDERFLRTSLYTTKVNKYINSYVPRTPDSINVAVDFIAEKAMVNNEVYKFIIVSLLNDYANSKIMGMDGVYVHIVDTYYKTGKAPWLDDAALFRIVNQADRIRPTLIGKSAPQIMLQDTNKMDIPLYSIKSKYTMILFWDVDCSHCMKELPIIVEMYPEFKAMGGEIYAVYSQEEWDKWIEFLRKEKYPWINVGNTSLKSDFQVKYNVDQTPIIFILDENKKIIAKKLGAEQVLGFLHEYSDLPLNNQ
ncbi:MAG: DUF5106 domain-containing protein [Bacteroidetes bacterium]|nr:DUF5106 domain-containing protein [Bacteroidota bacterium]MBP9703987.1 DUF5106 domain-containing protein [Chitinophagales bacterium]